MNTLTSTELEHLLQQVKHGKQTMAAQLKRVQQLSDEYDAALSLAPHAPERAERIRAIERAVELAVEDTNEKITRSKRLFAIQIDAAMNDRNDACVAPKPTQAQRSPVRGRKFI